MIGFVHQVFFEFIQRKSGVDAARKIKLASGLSPDAEFRYDSVYPDEEWQKILTCACEALSVSGEELEAEFGDFCADTFPEKFPGFLKDVSSAREHLLRQPLIHNTLASALTAQEQDNVTRKFFVEELSDKLIIHYSSVNRHCTLYKRIAQKVLERYREIGSVWEEKCMKNGDTVCEIHVKFFGRQD